MKSLLDSNVVIHLGQGVLPTVRAMLTRGECSVASIVRIEVFGFHRLSQEESTVLREVFAMLSVHALSEPIIDSAINLRQFRKMRLGDAIIAATALEHGVPLMTRNVVDFANIPGLTVVNPFETHEKESAP